MQLVLEVKPGKNRQIVTRCFDQNGQTFDKLAIVADTISHKFPVGTQDFESRFMSVVHKTYNNTYTLSIRQMGDEYIRENTCA